MVVRMNEATLANSDKYIEESEGACVNYHKCKNVGTLGNGLCMECWDGSLYRRGRKKPRVG